MGRFFLVLILLCVVESSIPDCISNSPVPHVDSNSTMYTNETRAFNIRIQPKPMALFIPSKTEDIIDIVRCAFENGLRVVSRSGGHSYSSNGLGGTDGAVVIDLKNFQEIKVNASALTAAVGGGALIGQMYEQLWIHGGFGTSHGTDPYVGIGGLCTGGGYGYMSRLWGMTLDNFVEAKIVIANGTLVTASLFQNMDLLYALRGAGSSFGVITEFTLKVHTPPSTVIMYLITFNSPSPDQITKGILGFQSWFRTTNIPQQMALTLILAKGRMELFGTYYGTIQQLTQYLYPLYDAMGLMPSSSNITSYNWIESLNAIAETDGGKLGTHDNFYAKSLLVPSGTVLTTKSVQNFVNILVNQGKDVGTFIEIETYGGKGSAINSVNINDTSFIHRNSIFSIQFYSGVSTDKTFPLDGLKFQDDLKSALQSSNSSAPWESYQNYMDPRLVDWQELYYGGAYSKLQYLKKKWDPSNVFRFPQSIEPKK